MQASAEAPRRSLGPEPKRVQDRKKQVLRTIRAGGPRRAEPFNPAHGCVEWFIYEETRSASRAAGD